MTAANAKTISEVRVQGNRAQSDCICAPIRRIRFPDFPDHGRNRIPIPALKVRRLRCPTPRRDLTCSPRHLRDEFRESEASEQVGNTSMSRPACAEEGRLAPRSPAPLWGSAPQSWTGTIPPRRRAATVA